MKSNLFCTLALGVFLVCALYTVWLSVVYHASVRQLSALQYQYARIEQTQNALDSLLNEALIYSKKHPALTPTLQKFIKPRPAATNAPAEATPKAAAP